MSKPSSTRRRRAKKQATLVDVLTSLYEDNEELLDWYAMSPAERFAESQKMWSTFLLLGGSLEPEPDSQSPFNFSEE